MAAGLPAQPSDQTGLAITIDLAHLAIVIPVLLLITGAAALIAARRTPATGSSNDNFHQIRPAAPGQPDHVRIDDSPRVRQGLGAGMTAGAVAGLMITILLGWWPTLLFGPLLAVPAALYGAMTGAQAAPPEPRLNRSWLGGVFAASMRGTDISPADDSPA